MNEKTKLPIIILSVVTILLAASSVYLFLKNQTLQKETVANNNSSSLTKTKTLSGQTKNTSETTAVTNSTMPEDINLGQIVNLLCTSHEGKKMNPCPVISTDPITDNFVKLNKAKTHVIARFAVREINEVKDSYGNKVSSLTGGYTQLFYRKVGDNDWKRIKDFSGQAVMSGEQFSDEEKAAFVDDFKFWD